MSRNELLDLTDASFAKEVESNPGLTLVDFWAEWCGPCHAIAPTIEALATKYEGQVKVARLNVDEHPGTMGRYRVRSIPSVVLFKDGAEVDRVIGADPRLRVNLEGKLERYLAG